MERLCRACRDWHDLGEPWPDGCMAHWKPATAVSDIAAPMVMRDIEPYRSMITGERIQGRRQHRDHLKAHQCIEIGNEVPKARKYTPSKTSRREKLHKQLADVSDRQADNILKQLKKDLHV